MQIFWKEYLELTEQEKKQAEIRAAGCGYTEKDYPDLVFHIWEDKVQGLTNKKGQYFKERAT